MSAERELAAIDVARRVLGGLQSDDPDAAATEALHPDVEWYGSVGGLEPGLFSGRDQVLASFQQYRSSWAQLAFDEEAAIAAGEKVLLLVRESGEGLGSGATVQQASAGLLTIREGRVTHVVTYIDRARALADAGVPEEEAAAIEPGGAYALREGRLVPLT